MPADIQIDRLRLSLPPEWRGKEQLVARALARELSQLQVPESVTLPRLTIPAVKIHGGETYPAVVRRIAAQVQDQLNAPATVPSAAPSSPLTPPSHA